MTCKEFRAQHRSFCKFALQTPKEKNKQFIIELPAGSLEQFLRIRIDGGLLGEINPAMKRCDWGFIRCARSDYYFVELKGEHVETAVQQLTETIVYFRKKYGVPCENTYAFVVSSGLPRAANQRFQRLQEKFLKDQVGVTLAKQTNLFRYRVEG